MLIAAAVTVYTADQLTKAWAAATLPPEQPRHLIGSVQAMPGYHNKLDLTLSRAGVYRILCLEYCGLNHSTMESLFTVTRS